MDAAQQGMIVRPKVRDLAYQFEHTGNRKPLHALKNIYRVLLQLK